MVAKVPPTSVRWSRADIRDRLHAFAAQHNVSISSAAETLVDEALRMREHPAIVFRDGPTGRRSALAAGPDVWEVIRSLRNARTHAPDVSEQGRVRLVADNAGLTPGQVQAAVGYYAAYPDEVDRMVAEGDAAEHAAQVAWERRRELLA